MRRKRKFVLMTALVAFLLTGCTASMQRAFTDIKSDWEGGLNRVINVYTANGDLIARYEGKIDIDRTEGGYRKLKKASTDDVHR